MSKDDSLKRCCIAFINVMDSYSGGEIVLQRLIRGLDKSKFDVVVYTKKTKFVETLECSEVEVKMLDTQYQLKTQRGIGAFFRAVKNFLISGKYMYRMKFFDKVDIVHSNSLTSSIYFAFWAKLLGVNFIAHNHLIRRGFVYKILYRYINFCSNIVICVSEAVKKNWLLEGVPDKKLTVVYNGLPSDFF